ncbi:MAG: UDP-2,3-diacylglucosamine diphosphatase LpxG [Parachlamydiales bacterium]|jgi:hypothetical protein
MNKAEPSSHKVFDALCIASIIGIWPRYCEPNILSTNYVTLKIKDLPAELDGLRILQFSDLHISSDSSDKFLAKVQKKAAKFSADINIFSGDFLCRSQLDAQSKEKLSQFLNSFPKARYGSFAVLGNHDYAEFVSTNKEGEYAISSTDKSAVSRGLSKIFSRSKAPNAMRIDVHNVPLHNELLQLLAKTPFRLLHNVSSTIPINGSALNIAGLGEYSLGRFDPENAFRLWDERFPGIIIAHNPDCAPHLVHFPGAVILSGHTHGGQINFPIIGKRFLSMENPSLKKGMIHTANKWLYVNRGIGSLIPLRWFAPPEILCLTLVQA